MRIDIDKQIKENIKHRYLVKNSTDYDKRAKSVVDKFFPSFFYNNEIISMNAAFISKFLSVYTNTKHIAFSELIYNFIQKDDLRALLLKVKSKKLNISLIGYGGMGINLIHFISLLSNEVNVKALFKTLHIYEADNLSFSNSFRIYKDITQYSSQLKSMNKLALFDEYDIAHDVKLHKKRFEDSDINDEHIHIGAPDFNTRKTLYKSKFIFTGHQNDSIMFVSSPEVSSSLTIESYGSINLTTFFLNLIASTLKLLELFAQNDISSTYAKNKKLYEYSILDDAQLMDKLNEHLKIYY